MTIRKGGKVIIDLQGPQGNSFFLMGRASQYAKQLGLDKDKVIDEMMSGDYENVLQTFDKYFGDYCIIKK